MSAYLRRRTVAYCELDGAYRQDIKHLTARNSQVAVFPMR
jgi:hypothetical protein